ncbi:MAG TPA: Calx-beta domain-containing protein, partial [Pyrinomonadaceae bacterium]
MTQSHQDRRPSAPSGRRLLTTVLFAVAAFACVASSARDAGAQTTGSPDLVISQVYTRGGEAGATFRNDYVEVFNRGGLTVNLADYTLQVLVSAPAAPGFPGGLTAVNVRFVSSGGGVPLAPGKYVLYQFGSSGSGGVLLPVTPDSNNSTPVNLNLPADRGRVALVKGAPAQGFAQYGCGVGVDATLADFFSYGPTTCAEGGSNFPAPTVTTAALRFNDGCSDGDENVSDFGNLTPNPRNTSSPARLCALPAPASVFNFDATSFAFSEIIGAAEITVTRSGDLSAPASVQYATSNDTATDRADYTTTFGTLNFAPGDVTKSFRVLVTDDGRAEGDEGLTLTLNYPTGGAGLGLRHISAIVISDNDGGIQFPNPIDQTDFFVRQHYADFLSRVPDESGRTFWTAEIDNCGADAACREVKRVNVSAAFFLSIEFQDTGFFAYRAYKAAFPDSSSRLRGFPLYRELWRDAQSIGRGVVVGQGNWQAQLAANKQAYALEFVQRPEFLIRYPQSLRADQFVDSLNATAGSPLSPAER